MMHWGDGTTWWGWTVMSVSMLTFWGAVAWGVWYLVTNWTREEVVPPEHSAQRILDERFARGEIGADAHERRQHALRDGSRGPVHTPPGA